MIPLHDLPGPGEAAPLLVRALRRLGHAAHAEWRAAAPTLIVWLLCVAGFAAWTLFHYHVQGSAPWIGMTIRTSAFASWLLVAREWLLIQLRRRARAPGQNTSH